MFTEPQKTGLTVYSKSNCQFCSKIKNFLNEKNIFFTEINCDNYLTNNKEGFLSYIKNMIGRSYATFPMIF